MPKNPIDKNRRKIFHVVVGGCSRCRPGKTVVLVLDSGLPFFEDVDTCRESCEDTGLHKRRVEEYLKKAEKNGVDAQVVAMVLAKFFPLATLNKIKNLLPKTVEEMPPKYE